MNKKISTNSDVGLIVVMILGFVKCILIRREFCTERLKEAIFMRTNETHALRHRLLAAKRKLWMVDCESSSVSGFPVRFVAVRRWKSFISYVMSSVVASS